MLSPIRPISFSCARRKSVRTVSVRHHRRLRTNRFERVRAQPPAESVAGGSFWHSSSRDENDTHLYATCDVIGFRGAVNGYNPSVTAQASPIAPRIILRNRRTSPKSLTIPRAYIGQRFRGKTVDGIYLFARKIYGRRITNNAHAPETDTNDGENLRRRRKTDETIDDDDDGDGDGDGRRPLGMNVRAGV